MPVLAVEHLYKKIGKREILKDINFSIEANEIVGLIGPNGAGKSTIMKSIASLIFPDSGTIQICEIDLHTNREKALANISAMIESPALYPQFTGMQHLEMTANLRKLPKSAIEEAAAFSKLKERLKDKATKYSMGMKQRLYLTMCMMAKPKLLVLDEPTNGIDFTGVIEFCDEMRNIAQTGTGILISSHILGDLQKLCDKFVFIKEGEIQQTIGKTSQTDIEQMYLRFFGGGQENE